jgi:hypothetical protein
MAGQRRQYKIGDTKDVNRCRKSKRDNIMPKKYNLLLTKYYTEKRYLATWTPQKFGVNAGAPKEYQFLLH